MLSKNELHIALLQLDQDNDGTISFPELQNWWTGSSAHANIPVQESTNPLQQQQQQQQQQGTFPTTTITEASDDLETALHPGSVDVATQRNYARATSGAGWLRCTTLIVVVLFTLTSFSMIFVELFWASTQENAKRGIWFFQAMLQVVLTSMGMLCVVLEGRVRLGETNCTVVIARNARLLNRVWGRGVYYLFLATMCCGVGTMQERVEDTATIVAGILLLIWSIVNIVFGCMAQVAMSSVGEISVEQAQSEFHLADEDGNGWLDLTELHGLLEKLNVHLGRTQLESAYIQIDADGDGKITEREFVAWTQREEVTNLVEQRVGYVPPTP